MAVSYKFYVQMDGDTFGPYSAKEVLGLGLLDDTLVTEESMGGQWLPASKFDFYDMYLKESGTVVNEDGSISRAGSTSSQSNSTTSSSSRNSYTPSEQELSKWNWGAFMFNWIWAICHGIYWPLLIILVNFIPYVGAIISFGACVYLGINGTKMAWESKSWPSWESFQETQHKWAVAILWVLGISLIIGILAGIAAGS